MQLVRHVGILVPGLVLFGTGIYGLFLQENTGAVTLYVLIAPFAVLVLWPVAVITSAREPHVSSDVRSQARNLWLAYAGLAVYGSVVGGWLVYLGSRGSHENYAGAWGILMNMLHLAVFGGGGLMLLLTPRLRSAGQQMFVGYAVMMFFWIVAGILSL